MTPPGRRFIAWAARFVPFHRRRAWQAEWEAEAAYAWARLTRNGRPPRAARIRLRLRIWTCLIDALWEMKETGTMMGPLTDLRLALRALMRRPLFASVAVLTLALGIGASAAVFTLVDGVLFSPLPYPDADRLVAVEHQGRDGAGLPTSPGLYRLYAEQSRSLDGIAMHLGSAVNLMTPDREPERVDARLVTPSFFRVLGVDAQLGRAFTDAEGAPGGDPVVILSDAAWQSSFGGDPTVLGQSLDLNGTLH